jgi:RNA polymerase II subunit A small phosphatase-like protein
MKRLIVLDLDETLIHTESVPEEWAKHLDYDFKFKGIGESLFYTKKRSFLDEFLDFSFKNFDVAIWTAAGKDYAKNIIKGIGLEERDLSFLYTQENCTIRLNLDFSNYYGIKDLKKVKKYGYSLEQTLIIDDVRETAVNNYGNLILIKEFTGDSDDTELLKLINYLEKIKDEPNYRRIEKRGWSV